MDSLGASRALGTGPAGQERQAAMNGTMRLASYNVHRFFDDIDDPNKRDALHPKPEESLASLAEVLKAGQADVVALQEVETFDLLRDFRDRYHLEKLYPHLVLIEGNDKKGMDVALLSRYPVKAYKSHVGRVTGHDHGEPQHFRRDLLQADLELPGHQNLRVYCAHYIAQGDDWCDSRRLEEARTTVDIVKEEQALKPADFTAVLGDFNDTEDSAVLRALQSGGELIDASAGVGPSWGALWPTEYPARQFDHVLASPELSLRQSGRGLLRHPLAPKVSDHLMVYADFKRAA